jgi:alpha-glucosidase
VDFGYDVSDYQAIDPKFGTMEDFDQLLSAAHQRGIKIILDLVLNHTSDQHPWFLESRSSRDNPYRDWYIWKDNRGARKPPNNWASIFGGKAWEYDPHTGQYYYHMFYKEQPDLNWRNPDVRQAMLDVFTFWLEKGVDGFRLDVFNVYFKSQEWKDNPPALGIRGFDRQKHIHDIDQPELVPLLEEIRALLDSYPERYAVGETFISNQEKDILYSGKGRLHAVFNFTFTHAPWRVDRFKKAIQDWEALYDQGIHPTYVLNNHDVIRSATRYRTGEDDRKLKVSAAMLLTLRGTPFLYYGEEIGQRDIHVRRSEILDPVGKKYWPLYKGRDGCRAPMQWNNTENAGFTSGPPWLPVNPDYPVRHAAAQSQDPDSLFHFYRSLLHLRKDHEALRTGEFKFIDSGDPQVLGYLRWTQSQTLLILLNYSDRSKSISLKSRPKGEQLRILLSTARETGQTMPAPDVELAPYEASIFTVMA